MGKYEIPKNRFFLNWQKRHNFFTFYLKLKKILTAIIGTNQVSRRSESLEGREGPPALSSPDTRRVPWSVLTILPRSSSYICFDTKYIIIFGIFPLAFSRLIVGYLYERGDRK